MLTRFARPRERRVTCRLVCLLFALAGFAASGCSGGKPALVPTKGSVKVGGEAAKGAVVMFHPQGTANGQTASGVVGDDGTFTLSSGLDQGLAPGTYKVTVTWEEKGKEPTEAERMQNLVESGPDRLKGKYSDVSKTTLTAEIKAGQSELPPFELEAPK